MHNDICPLASETVQYLGGDLLGSGGKDQRSRIEKQKVRGRAGIT